MKIGSRVRLCTNPAVRGQLLGLCGWRADVRWDDGIVSGHHLSGLMDEVIESFPYRSHRTMAQVIADEQKPEPA